MVELKTVILMSRIKSSGRMAYFCLRFRPRESLDLLRQLKPLC